ncbi:hypothetical protein RhiJN_23140 [Ceratobasidium sp. AG-Ba]|nr:hypothetical protein RhiJN_23140 [Ceratobasidium sp. AG-Ba]
MELASWDGVEENFVENRTYGKKDRGGSTLCRLVIVEELRIFLVRRKKWRQFVKSTWTRWQTQSRSSFQSAPRVQRFIDTVLSPPNLFEKCCVHGRSHPYHFSLQPRRVQKRNKTTPGGGFSFTYRFPVQESHFDPSVRLSGWTCVPSYHVEHDGEADGQIKLEGGWYRPIRSCLTGWRCERRLPPPSVFVRHATDGTDRYLKARWA